MSKRENYISWDEYFISVALVSSMRSKDPNTQVGACIVDKENKIVSIGYNGFPTGCSDDDLPWGSEGDFLQSKYAYSCHAELNAILNSSRSNLKSCSVYTTLFPCNECAKAIIQSGITEIVYLSDKYKETDIVKASKYMLDKSGVTIRKFSSERKGIDLSFDENDV